MEGDNTIDGAAAEPDLGDRRCSICGAVLLPFELPSGAIVNRCPACGALEL